MASKLVIQYKDGGDGPGGGTLEVPFEAMRDMAQRMQQLEESLAVLQDGTPRSQLGSKKYKDAITALDQAKTVLSPLIRDMWQLVPLRDRPSAESAKKATEAFGTPEILELLLLQLGPWDLLRVNGVNTHWRAVIDGSILIQRDVLVMRPDFEACFRQPFGTYDLDGNPLTDPDFDYEKGETDKFRGLRSITRPRREDKAYTVELEDGKRKWIVDRKKLLEWTIRPFAFTPGPRARTMLLVQPPVTDLNLVTCVPRYNDEVEPFDPSETVRLTIPTGITVGDFHDATLEYLREHRVFCIDCDVKGSESHLHAYGFVTLVDNDPVIKEDRRAWEAWEEEFGGGQ